MKALAQVAVDVAAEGTDRLFTYLVPEALAGRLTPGQWVQVPFGPRRVVGLDLGPAAAAPPGVQMRALERVLTDLPALPAPLLDLARWLADYYVCHFVQALRLLLPAQARRQQVKTLTQDHVRLTLAADAVAPAVAEVGKKTPVQARVLQTLVAAGGDLPASELRRACGDRTTAALKALAARGWLTQVAVVRRRDPFGGEAATALPLPALTPAQAEALAVLEKTLRLAGTGLVSETVLLHGVTGSGKTEVYLRAIAACLAAGKQAIVLVPEISLTPQTVARFRGRFGAQVAVLHSALGAGERFDEWVRIRQGEVQIVVGARSAVFAPFARLGLIVIDEEHESSYKQDEAPRYHARLVAAERCRREGAVLLLGSATPGLETYWRAQRGEIGLAVLDRRIDDRPLPQVELVDLREELRQGNRSIFSQRLQALLATVLNRREQAVLFLNRRGFNTFVMCRACGHSVGCPNCSVALTYHLGGSRLSCHYCDHSEPVPRVCPQCASTSIRYFGAGTEKVEQEVQALLPGARVLRMDVDTTQRKGSHAAILKAFGAGEADILVGTQMIAKGHDFPRVTLVGVISADTSLNLPDFRAAERTFSLITQVAGRAGRADLPGQVVVQSYTPEHFSLQAAVGHDYAAFFAREIVWRQEQGYPPFARFVHLVVSGPEEPPVLATALEIRRLLLAAGVAGEILGPAPAPLARLRGQFRHHLVLRGEDAGRLGAGVRAALAGGSWRRGKAIRLSIDVEPESIL